MLKCNRSLVIALAIESLVWLLTPAANAQVELERLYPPVVAAGSTSTIKADGKFPVWPLNIVCDRADVSLTCGEKAGEFQVIVSQDAAPGAAWLRLHDTKATTSLVPLLIERSTVTLDVEPNDTLSKALAVSCPVVIAGRLEKNGDVDMWKFQASRGQQLVVSISANRLLNSPMDAVLQLLDTQGNVLAQADDDRGLDPQLIYEASADTEFLLRLFAFPETPNSTIGFAGGANFNYVLKLTNAAFVDHLLPFDDVPVETLKRIPFGWNLPADPACLTFTATEVSPPLNYLADSMGWQWQPAISSEVGTYKFDTQLLESVEPISVPLKVYGHIAEPNELDRVRIKVKAGESYRARVWSRAFGFLLDSVLRVVKPDGSELARNDDAERSQYDAAVEFKSDIDGELVVELSDLAGSGSLRHAYALEIVESKPRVNLTIEADHFVVEAGKSIEIPVKIQRQYGYAQKLELVATNLPAGVSVEKATSEPKGDSSKSVKLKLLAAADASTFQGPIQFIATQLEGDKQSQAALPITHSLRGQFDLKQVWLSVTKGK